MNDSITYWHITFGTYGTRLHGGDRPTVDRSHNRPGQPYIESDPGREIYERMELKCEPVVLNRKQRVFIHKSIPHICVRGGWSYLVSAAAGDHVHVLCGAKKSIHGKAIRALLKRWLTQALRDEFPESGIGQWWAEGGSTRAVKNHNYLVNVRNYIQKQQTTG